MCSPPLAPPVIRPKACPRYPIFISAYSDASLTRYCSLLVNTLTQSTLPDEQILSDIAFKLASNQNRSLPRLFITTANTVTELRSKLSPKTLQPQAGSKAKPVVLAFSGQTSNFIGLCKDVYEGSVLFRSHLNRCDTMLQSSGQQSLFPNIFSIKPIEDLISLHSMLFSYQYASAMSWIDSGMKIDALVGHSFGQVTALCISGVLSLPDTLKLVSERASLMQELWGPERGSMILIDADIDTVNQIMSSAIASGSDNHVSVACYNAASSHVLVGPAASIDAVEHSLAGPHEHSGRTRFRRLTTTHGFHSEFTEPILPGLTELTEQLEIGVPTIPLETCSEGQSWTNIEPRHIVEHTRLSVFRASSSKDCGATRNLHMAWGGTRHSHYQHDWTSSREVNQLHAYSATRWARNS